MAVSKDTESKIFFNLTAADAEVEVSEEYIGDLPRARERLAGVISKIYLDETASGDPVFKVLYVCTEQRYNGFTAWDNVTLTPKAAFKWKPLITALGVTVDDLAMRTQTDSEQVSGAGVRVVRIGELDLSGENEVPVYFGVKYRKYDDLMQTDVIAVRSRALTDNEINSTVPK